MRSSDTTRDAEEVQLALYRRLDGTERVAIAVRMSNAVRDITLGGIRSSSAIAMTLTSGA